MDRHIAVLLRHLFKLRVQDVSHRQRLLYLVTVADDLVPVKLVLQHQLRRVPVKEPLLDFEDLLVLGLFFDVSVDLLNLVPLLVVVTRSRCQIVDGLLRRGVLRTMLPEGITRLPSLLFVRSEHLHDLLVHTFVLKAGASVLAVEEFHFTGAA